MTELNRTDLNVIIHHFNARYVFLLMTYYLLFIFILDYRNDARQKENSRNFFIQVQMCHKAAETTLHTNNIFDPGTASKRSVQWKFKMFCKEDKSLENEEHSG